MAVQLGTHGQPGFDDPISLLKDCHQRIEHFLGVIKFIVEHAPGGRLDQESTMALRTALHYFREAAPLHTADEEDSLFPELRALGRQAVEPLIKQAATLEVQHRQAESLHERVHARLDGWLDTNRLDALTRTELRCDVASLRALYRDHIAFEDNVLFPATIRVLDAGALTRIGRAMAARRGIGIDQGGLARQSRRSER